ncbi:MAG: ATP-binding protein, partial [Muribaculaceae bacterium]|nr:ATP-binding protein [Muribaculaceae bacterium]
MEKELLYPIDTASFRRIRENGLVYVDKTGYIHTLVEQGTYYFLARPRRFGKSLFLDTLAEYFEGNRPLFRGLAIDSLQPGEWESFPVVRFDLTGKTYTDKESLISHISGQLDILEDKLGLERSTNVFDERFDILIRRATEKAGRRVVVLVDEYDAPLVATIDNRELQEVYREQLHGFYSVLKKSEANLKFCMLTGVTRFGKVSVFSGLNNLNDITFSNTYAAICGITTEELHHTYHTGIEQLAAKHGLSTEEAYDLLKFHYDGYHFSDLMVDIYNPFSINYSMYNLEIEDYWCQSGAPTILSKALLNSDFDISTLEGKRVDKAALSDLSVYAMNPIPLFYQTGYLTLKAYEPRRKRYTIGYPNREVESSILNNILEIYMPSPQPKRNYVYDIEDALEDGDVQQFIKILSSFLANIPSQLHKYVDRYENYYHTILYCLTTLIGLDVDAEYSTSEGFIDIVIRTDNYLYIIELKINGTAEDAMVQIESKHYAAPFAADGRQVVKIGLGFSKDT